MSLALHRAVPISLNEEIRFDKAFYRSSLCLNVKKVTSLSMDANRALFFCFRYVHSGAASSVEVSR